MTTSTDPLNYFPNFLYKVWTSLGLPPPTPLQYDFACYLDEIGALEELFKEAEAGGQGARRILMAFRGAAKTYVATAYAVFRLRKKRNEEVLVVSATDRFASSISTFAFQMVTEFDWLSDMKPGKNQRSSALAFDVRGSPAANKDMSFSASSIFGQITGKRATLILGDDLETPNTAETETKRTQLRLRMGELGGAIIKPGGDIYLLGTPQHEQTVYKEYAEEKGYEIRIYPILHPIVSDDPKKDEMQKYGTHLAPIIADALKENPLLAGTSTEPSRFNALDIAQRQKEWGTLEFERQFKMWMDAGLGTDNVLKLRDWLVMDISPPQPGQKESVHLPAELQWTNNKPQAIEGVLVDSLTGDGILYGPLKQDVWVPAEEVICSIDPSGEGKDETTWTILGGLSSRIFVLKQGASTEGHSEGVLKQIARDCKEWGATTAEVESNFGQGMFSTLLQVQLDLEDCVCEAVDVRVGKTQKERRIVETLEPVMTGHRLVVNTQVIRDDWRIKYTHVEEAKRRFFRLTYQITRITKQRGALKFDDRVDSLASGVAHFVERLLLALDDAKNASKDRAIRLEAEKIIAARQAAGLPVLGLQADANKKPFGKHSGQTKRNPSG